MMSHQISPQFASTLVQKRLLSHKAEIPKESTGRLIDALTDAIRPFTEKQGLKADIIRLQREDVALEIATRALKRKEIEGLSLKAVPNKILIPIFEKGSLEEPGSTLIDWWSNLLIAGATQESVRPFLIDLMTAVGDQEAKFLHSLWRAFTGHFVNAEPIIRDPTFAVSYIMSTVKPRIDAHLSKIFIGKPKSLHETELSNALGQEMFALSGWGDQIGTPIELSIPVRFDVGMAALGQRSLCIENAGPAVDVCKALNILREHVHFEPVPGMIGVQARYDVRILLFTKLGVEFMEACQPITSSTSAPAT